MLMCTMISMCLITVSKGQCIALFFALLTLCIMSASCSYIQFVLRAEPNEHFLLLGRTMQHLSLLLREFSLWQSVLMCELITDQIFVKGDCVPPFPFDWKGELSALNVELRSGKWVSYLFQIVDLSWVKWKSFMLEGRKRPTRGRNLSYQSFSRIYLIIPIPVFFLNSDLKASERQKLHLHLKR